MVAVAVTVRVEVGVITVEEVFVAVAVAVLVEVLVTVGVALLVAAEDAVAENEGVCELPAVTVLVAVAPPQRSIFPTPAPAITSEIGRAHV